MAFIQKGTFSGAKGLDPVLVQDNADVTLPDGEIKPEPDAWKANLILADGKAIADKAFEISGEHLIASITGKIEGENKEYFTWNETKQIVKFSATAAGTYKAQLVLSSTGAQDKTVELEIKVDNPIIPELIVMPTEWTTNLLIKGGKAEA